MIKGEYERVGFQNSATVLELAFHAARSYSLMRPPRADASVCQDRVERPGELPGPVTNQVPEARSTTTQFHQQVVGLLRGPWPVRARGDAEDVHVPCAAAAATRQAEAEKIAVRCPRFSGQGIQ